ncbi:hypothetical protein B7457_09390 [Enterobacter hormaechei subsp. hoffmannii]|uniref:Uncharacterized protein n=1 Tax=Enterobacter hormaechei TaxID=158836 RepID=A0A855VRT7_9ENTR|nr:hypothetical protein AM429_12775 [Enterobacter cloacae complex sp.]AVU19658.1 hypothetical protein AO413_08630 [Enterobacter cloacae]OWP93722.1 hypothetical protein B7457_09390 [Enterobacter hormaechei subsp. hoffmannii]PTX88160.1 hypothetical protein C1O12_07080 [Enterobacter hormaechei]OWP97058.1 hypothetical protein B7456_08500 [Enterobacter hormaechei subsp. hoffmannii]
MGKKYWKQCEQCRTEYLSDLLNYSVMRKIIFLSKRCNPTMSVERQFLLLRFYSNEPCDSYHKFPFSDPVLSFSVSLI